MERQTGYVFLFRQRSKSSSHRLDDLVFDASKGKKAIESALSEFRVIVGAEDVIGGPRMLGELWLV